MAACTHLPNLPNPPLPFPLPSLQAQQVDELTQQLTAVQQTADAAQRSSQELQARVEALEAEGGRLAAQLKEAQRQLEARVQVRRQGGSGCWTGLAGGWVDWGGAWRSRDEGVGASERQSS